MIVMSVMSVGTAFMDCTPLVNELVQVYDARARQVQKYHAIIEH